MCKLFTLFSLQFFRYSFYHLKIVFTAPCFYFLSTSRNAVAMVVLNFLEVEIMACPEETCQLFRFL